MSKTDIAATKHAVSHEGGSLYVLDYPGEEPAIVLMHGFPDDHRIYDKLLPQLAPSRAVAFDWLGYGRSDRSDTAGFASEELGDPDGVAIQSILPQFFGSADQPDALAAIRAWTASLFDSLNEQDALIDIRALSDLEGPVSIIFGEADFYLNPSLAREIGGLFTDPSLHVVPGASHWPQHDQPQVVADLLADIASNESQR